MGPSRVGGRVEIGAGVSRAAGSLLKAPRAVRADARKYGPQRRLSRKPCFLLRLRDLLP